MTDRAPNRDRAIEPPDGMNGLEAMLDSTDTLVACMDRRFNFVRVNRAYAEADQQVPSFFPGKNHFALYPNEENERIFRRVVETGEPFSIHAKPFVYAEHPERGVSYWDWTLTPIRNDSGLVTGVVLSLANVTARVLAEHHLRESQQRLQAILDNTTAMIYVKDREGRFTLVNRRLLEHFGFRTEDIIGKTDRELFPKELADVYRENDLRVMESGQPWKFEEAYTAPEGTRTNLSVKVPLRDPSGNVYATCGISADITEQKRAEHVLANYVQTLVGMAPIAVVTVNAAGQIQKVNRFALELTGYTEDEVKGPGWLGLLAEPSEAERLLPLIAKAFEGKAEQGVEVLMRAKDGRQVAMRWYVALQKDDRGEPSGLVAIGADVTESRQREQQLVSARQDAEAERYRLLAVLNAAPVGVAVADANGRIVLQNSALYEIWRDQRQPPSDIDDYQRFAGFWPDTGNRIEPHEWPLAKAVTEGQVTAGQEVIFERLDGSHAAVILSAAPVRDADGRIIGAVVTALDITSREEAEQELQASQARLAEAQHIAHVGNWEWVIEIDALLWSDEVFRLFGRSPQEFQPTYRLFLEAIHPEDRQAVREAVDRALQGKEHYAIDHRIALSTGEVRVVHEQGEVTFDQSGRPVRMAGTVQDITEHRRLEEQLRQAAKMEAIGRLAGGVAHDFNNYLTAIKGFGSLLAQGLPADSPLHEDLHEIAKAAERARQLTTQLLAFGRRAVVKPEIIDLNEILASMAKTLKRLLREDIELVVEPGPGLWSVKADPNQVQQAILNLAINARDAMPTGGLLRITTRNVASNGEGPRTKAKPGRCVELAVSDTGVGMAPDVLDHLFEPFFTTKRTGEGTGLGLATVHGIVTQCGGHVAVDSRPGEGATFRLCFPAVDALAHVHPEAPEGEACPGGTETILIVEDEDAVRDFMVRALRTLGYRTLEARSPSEAEKIGRQHAREIDLLLSDIVMPEMNGLELAKRLRNVRPDLPALFVSGYPKDAIPDRNIAEADIELLLKPFTIEELCASLRRVLGATRKNRDEGG